MKKKRWLLIALILFLAAVLAVAAIFAFHMTGAEAVEYGFARQVSEEEAALRLQLVYTAEGWHGASELYNSHKPIIDIYNSHEPLAVGYLVQYSDNWCATFVSCAAIQCHLTDIIPTECGCQRQIALFQDLGRWEESDDYVPLPGDIIYYSGKDSVADNIGWSDHVGIVVGTHGNWIKVIEGNYLGMVEYRIIPIGDSYIRGYGLPDYTNKCDEKTDSAE